jgi:hypothetical protein
MDGREACRARRVGRGEQIETKRPERSNPQTCVCGRDLRREGVGPVHISLLGGATSCATLAAVRRRPRPRGCGRKTARGGAVQSRAVTAVFTLWLTE